MYSSSHSTIGQNPVLCPRSQRPQSKGGSRILFSTRNSCLWPGVFGGGRVWWLVFDGQLFSLLKLLLPHGCPQALEATFSPLPAYLPTTTRGTSSFTVRTEFFRLLKEWLSHNIHRSLTHTRKSTDIHYKLL